MPHITVRRTDAGHCNASLGLGGHVALAYPEWASLPVGVLPLLHACPKFRVPTLVGGVLSALTSLGQSQLAVYFNLRVTTACRKRPT